MGRQNLDPISKTTMSTLAEAMSGKSWNEVYEYILCTDLRYLRRWYDRSKSVSDAVTLQGILFILVTVNMKRQNEWLKQLIGTPSRISKPQTLILPDLSSWPVEDEHLNKIMYGRCRSDIRLADDSLKGHAAGTPDRRPKSRVSVGRQSVSAARRSIISSQGDSVVKRLRFSQEIALQNQGFQPQLAKRNQKLNRNRAASVPQSTRHLQYTSPRHSYPTSPRLSTPHPPQQKGKQKIAAAAKTYSPVR